MYVSLSDALVGLTHSKVAEWKVTFRTSRSIGAGGGGGLSEWENKREREEGERRVE